MAETASPAEQAAAPAPKQRRRNWLSFSLRSLLILVTLCCLAVGGKLKYDWYRKKWLVEAWVAPLVKEPYDQTTSLRRRLNLIAPLSPPEGVKAKDEVELLHFGILELDTPEERFAALKILVESRKEESLPILRELVPQSRHPEMQAMLLHLISLHLESADVARMLPLLQSPHPVVRAAAAESIGYLREPTYRIEGPAWRWFDPFGRSRREILLNTNPPIEVSPLVQNQRGSSRLSEQDPPPEPGEAGVFSPQLRERLEEVMLAGATQDERTAAARALVAWPPPEYSLRLAEWGVWADDQGKLAVARSVLEEIPPFVHRAGNPLASLAQNRFEGEIVILKPIIHLTADRPLAVDLEVAIASGRPWYAYPRPDDFTVRVNFSAPASADHESRLQRFDPRDWPTIQPVSEGYPWIHPLSRAQGMTSSRGPTIMAVGLKWQSVIVSPSKQPWASVASVDSSPRFRWWTALREVPSSWITSQGETERFLYYDGPTLAKPPLLTKLAPQSLTIASQDMFADFPRGERDGLIHHPLGLGYRQPDRECLLIEVHPLLTRALRFRHSGEPAAEETLNLAEQSWRTGDEAEQTLREMLLERGLTEPEAAGLMHSWREKFFATPGQRLLSFLSEAEYERMCPLEIRPRPSDRIRVGIVLTEL